MDDLRLLWDDIRLLHPLYSATKGITLRLKFDILGSPTLQWDTAVMFLSARHRVGALMVDFVGFTSRWGRFRAVWDSREWGRVDGEDEGDV